MALFLRVPFLLFASACALVRLPAHLSSGAVLQTWRGSHTATHLYGTADPGEVVTVSAAVHGVPPFSTTADAMGKWLIAYNWPPGPSDWNDFDVNVTGSSGSATTLRGVRWGDIGVCLGDASALLPTGLADGGGAWLSNASHALADVRLFPASVRGSCAWGGGAGGGAGPPCDAWTNATAALGADV